jgi:hypothetical protein
MSCIFRQRQIKTANRDHAYHNSSRFAVEAKEDKEHCMWLCWKKAGCPLDCEPVLVEDNLKPCCAEVMFTDCYTECEEKYAVLHSFQSSVALEPRFIDGLCAFVAVLSSD